MQTTVKHMRDMGRKQAHNRQSMARATARKRKEEYLGARVPKELRDKVIDKADTLGIPVSTLIRNILEQAFGASPDVTPVSESGSEPRGEPQKNVPSSDNTSKGSTTSQFPSVIGWERITLNKTMSCAACANQIKSGSEVTLGLAGPGEDHVILCIHCKAFA